VYGREKPERDPRERGQDDENPQGIAPSPELANEDAERKSRHQRERTAARDNGQRPGAMRVRTSQASGAVRVCLVGRRSNSSDDAATRHRQEVRSRGLQHGADHEHRHSRRKKRPAIPAASQSGNDRRPDRIDKREQRGQLASRADRHMQASGDLRQQSGQHEAVHAEDKRPDCENQQVSGPEAFCC